MLAQTAFDYANANQRKAVFDVMEKDRTAISMYERMGCVMLRATSYKVADGRGIPARCYAAPRLVDPAA